jgi:hypothetical protein
VQTPKTLLLSLRNLRNTLPPLLERLTPQLAHFALQPQPCTRPVRSLQRAHILLELGVPAVFRGFEKTNADFAVYGRQLHGFRLNNVVEQNGLLVEESTLVQSIARVEVEGQVHYCCCEGEAAELLGWRLALLSLWRIEAQVLRDATYEAGCEAHGGLARRQGL